MMLKNINNQEAVEILSTKMLITDLFDMILKIYACT